MGVSNFVESSFELFEFLLDDIFCDKIYQLICSTILAGKVYVCYEDYERAFDRVNLVKLLTVLKSIGVDWRG